MGQYGNQPDFGTKAGACFPNGSPNDDGLKNLESAALYIGKGGTLVCDVVGGNPDGAKFTVFAGIPTGTFFPVIVSKVFANDGEGTDTTCSDIIALY
jgi:hypothetical protein